MDRSWPPSGLEAADLRRAAGRSATCWVALLDFLLANEPLLLDFCQDSFNRCRRPFTCARHAAGGPDAIWRGSGRHQDRDRGAGRVRPRSFCGGASPPSGDYAGTVAAIAELVRGRRSASWARRGSVGLAIPGTVSRQTGLIKNANSVWLNGKPFARDLEAALGAPRAAGQ